MALDAVYLRHLVKEIENKAINSKVDKIFQPNKDELTIVLRNFSDTYKLLISANASNPRIYFTDNTTPNPKTPPMFCMLLRKKLVGAKLMSISIPDLERIVFLNFQTTNELGDKIRLSLIVEIMGKYSNIILVDDKDMIIDSIKRVDINISSKRLVLPKLKYQLPDKQNKLNMLYASPNDILMAIKNLPKEEKISKAIFDTMTGISPVISREIEHRLNLSYDTSNKNLDLSTDLKIIEQIDKLINITKDIKGEPYLIISKQGRPIEVSFLDIKQYGEKAKSIKYDTFSEALDTFYYERALVERIKSKTHNLTRLISNKKDRISRKVVLQKSEFDKSLKRDNLKIKGDLLQANLYAISKGMDKIVLQNFYNDMENITINLKPNLTPAQNAQLYYKKYHKASNAEKYLTSQIKKGIDEVAYLESILDLISRAKSDEEISEIRQELRKEGYLKQPKNNKSKKKEKKLPPIAYQTSGGFTVLVGRNNRQNDNLTMKKSKDNDIWFHVKTAPGSHTILVTNGNKVSEKDIFEAAVIAAKHSSCSNSSNVPVDYTKVKNVSKPNGAKPGMVIYVEYKTLYVTPEE